MTLHELIPPLQFILTGWFFSTRKRIERAKFEETYREILEKFEGYSLFKNVQGVWVDPTGQIVTDSHLVVFLLIEDTPQLDSWLQAYKQT